MYPLYRSFLFLCPFVWSFPSSSSLLLIICPWFAPLLLSPLSCGSFLLSSPFPLAHWLVVLDSACCTFVGVKRGKATGNLRNVREKNHPRFLPCPVCAQWELLANRLPFSFHRPWALCSPIGKLDYVIAVVVFFVIVVVVTIRRGACSEGSMRPEKHQGFLRPACARIRLPDLPEDCCVAAVGFEA